MNCSFSGGGNGLCSVLIAEREMEELEFRVGGDVHFVFIYVKSFLFELSRGGFLCVGVTFHSIPSSCRVGRPFARGISLERMFVWVFVVVLGLFNCCLGTCRICKL